LRHETDEEKKKNLITTAITLLPAGLKQNINVMTDLDQQENDLRYIYASLSRVSQTVDKQMDQA
jgi:hypothetical protein